MLRQYHYQERELTNIVECKESKQCAPMKHHFDECVERVTGADDSEKKGPHEDCVEECKSNVLYSFSNLPPVMHFRAFLDGIIGGCIPHVFTLLPARFP